MMKHQALRALEPLKPLAKAASLVTKDIGHGMLVISHNTLALLGLTLVALLTIIATLFMPLSFIAGVYGMNFDVMPEIRWQNGYLFFWVLSAVIFVLLFSLLRRARML